MKEYIWSLRDEPAIYVFTNKVNGRKYVGETMNARTRLMQHLKYLGNQVIHKAMAAHGLDNFDLQVTYYPNASKAFLLNLERFMIEANDSLSANGNGYNITPWGTSNIGAKFSDRTKKRMSLSKQGEKCYSAKLKDSDIPDIRAAKQAGENQASIARRYDLTRAAVSQIILGKTWKHI